VEKHEEKDATFLDYAASDVISNEALREFCSVSRLYGNSSGINKHAKILRGIEEESAKTIAEKLNARPEQILFVNNSTMANNIAILGVAYNFPGCHLITSKIEHKSVLSIFKRLENTGYRVTYLDVDKFGNVNLEQLSKSIRSDTKLISIQTFNSEIGTMQNMEAIGEIARKRGVLFHSDAAQSFCKYELDAEKTNVDLITLSGYKIGAPKGIAALYIRDKSRLRPILFGSGSQFFPGTKSTALIASLAAAVKSFRYDMARIRQNFHILTKELKKIGGVCINSTTPSHVVSVAIGGVLLKDILKEMKDYSFSAGCSCMGQESSNVVQAIDPERKLPTCILRISFSDKVDPADLIAFAKRLAKVVITLRRGKSIGIGCESVDEKGSGYFH
jgi:cysteine desulfurase